MGGLDVVEATSHSLGTGGFVGIAVVSLGEIVRQLEQLALGVVRLVASFSAEPLGFRPHAAAGPVDQHPLVLAQRENIAAFQDDGALLAGPVAKNDVKAAVENEEELVGVVVGMPHVVAERVGDADVVVVHRRDDTWAVELVERGEGLSQVHGLVYVHLSTHLLTMTSVHVVLVQPEIAPNTGAIIRLCANTGATLHLVEPLGFELGDRLLRRGGLDYHEYADMHVHADLDAVAATLTGRWFGFSARSTRRYTDIAYEDDDVLVFGTERAGLTPEQKERFPAEQLLTIPMLAGNRSMNLANAVSVVVYEAWRQADFAGAGADQPGLTSETTATAPFDS